MRLQTIVLNCSTSRHAKISALRHDIPWFLAVEIEEPSAPPLPPLHLLMFNSCRPCRHRGSKPPLDYNHAISDLLMTLHGTCLSAPTWLLQCLRYQHGSFFLHLRCSSVLLSCCASRLRGPDPCATQRSTLEGRNLFCCCIQTQIISLYQDAVSFGSDMLQCRGGGALWPSVDV